MKVVRTLEDLTDAQLRRLRADRSTGAALRERIDAILDDRSGAGAAHAVLPSPPRRPIHAGGGLALVIAGAPRTKKNHGRRVWSHRLKRPVHVPSPAYEAWVAAALPQLEAAPVMPDRPLNCAATFYRDRGAGDAVGYYQGLADLLEAAGVVNNDVWIVSWDGSRLASSRRRPRVELVLTVVSG